MLRKTILGVLIMVLAYASTAAAGGIKSTCKVKWVEDGKEHSQIERFDNDAESAKWQVVMSTLTPTGEIREASMIACEDSDGGKSFSRIPPKESAKEIDAVVSAVIGAGVSQADKATLTERVKERGGIQAMLTELHPLNAYIRPLTRERLQDGNAQPGFLEKGFLSALSSVTGKSWQTGDPGLLVSPRGGYLVVVSAVEDGPAFKAGLRPGDQVLEVNGEPVDGLTSVDVAQLLKGRKGEPVEVTITRQEFTKPLTVSLIRDLPPAKSVRARTLDGGYGYVRISQFRQGTEAEFKEALRSVNKSAGLILDLRNNAGGLLNEGINVASHFLPAGTVVVTTVEGKEKKSELRFSAAKGEKEHGYPLAVLVDGGTAGVAEVVAAALRDRGRAIVVGAQTFGKGSIQTFLPLSTGAAVRLTTGLFVAPGGSSFEGKGIAPEGVVDSRITGDFQIPLAIEALGKRDHH